MRIARRLKAESSYKTLSASFNRSFPPAARAWVARRDQPAQLTKRIKSANPAATMFAQIQKARDDLWNWLFNDPRKDPEMPPHITILNSISEGTFGDVWKANFRTARNEDVTVAIKVPSKKVRDRPEVMRSFAQESTTHRNLYHKNIIRVYTTGTYKHLPYIVMELASNKSLDCYARSVSHLAAYSDGTKLCRMCAGVAAGMEYLESLRMLHRDLAAKNILVTSDHTCKIADFGFSRKMQKHYVQGPRSWTREYMYFASNPNMLLPIRWTAPEVFTGLATIKSDVWSFGVVLWEVMSFGKIPFGELNLSDPTNFLKTLDRGGRLRQTARCRDDVYRLMCATWEQKPSDRPSFSVIRTHLEAMARTRDGTVAGRVAAPVAVRPTAVSGARRRFPAASGRGAGQPRVSI
eukprot:scpid67497/ scgid11403/ Tyrosine-protein kinase transforming protein Fps